jgi:SPP1 family predicted phage head-tail adaptor
MIRACDLDKRVTVQAKTVSYNGYNEPIETWSELATVWAQAITSGTKGREFTAAQKLFAEVSIVFRIRYRADVTPLHRVVYAGRTFGILAVEDAELTHECMLLTCREVV